MTETPTNKNAAYWLDRAIHFEAQGQAKSADMALNRAVKLDDEEHAVDQAMASLPRKTAV
ncbi:MAG: hypothetical protein ACR2RF_06090 [Geminicoccaceae bacterium]